ncbi:MAG: 5-(carboxyamino)imidazole ribonucleotide synthase [Bacteroidota bacterium]
MNLGNGQKIGVLGGGQLGLMLMEAAAGFNVELYFLDPDPNAPCAQFESNFTLGDFKDEKDVIAFAKGKDLITIEIENVNTQALRSIVKEGIQVYPSPDLIETIKDKGLQKEFYRKHQIPTSPFQLCENEKAYQEAIHSFPSVQKLRTGGYDGRGVQIVKSEEDFKDLFKAPSILEDFVPFEQEISVIVARNTEGEIKTFPTVGMQFNEEANLVEFLFSPADLSDEVEEKAQFIANKVAEAFNLVGIMAVEMFLTKDGQILVNESAPRPHNSGHQSIEGNETSQYEQHLRAIIGLPLGGTEITKPSVMVNLLGAKGYEGEVRYLGINELETESEVFVHLYGKKKTRPFRKLGHITVLAESIEDAKEKAMSAKEIVQCVA